MTVQAPPWPPIIINGTFRLRSNTGQFTSPLTGVVQRTARSGSKWEFDVQFASLDDTRTRSWRGFLALCQDQNYTFYWSPYPLGRPQNYPNGMSAATTCDSGTIKCDTTAVNCDATYSWGSPAIDGASQTGITAVVKGFTNGAVLVPGDFFAFDNGTYREMHMVTATFTADSTGAGTISFVPEIRRSPLDSAQIYLDGHTTDATHRCACEVIVATPDQAAYSLAGYQATMSFKLVEAIR